MLNAKYQIGDTVLIVGSRYTNSVFRSRFVGRVSDVESIHYRANSDVLEYRLEGVGLEVYENELEPATPANMLALKLGAFD